jgi:hypothetical protein
MRTASLTTLVAAAALATPLPAQAQFRELRKQPWPLHGTSREAPVIADFDGDSDRDVLWLGEPMQLLINDGTGLFDDQTAQRLPDTQLRLTLTGDLDGDGDLDLVRPGEPAVWLNDGRGRFATATGRLPTPPPLVYHAALVDCDGNRALDIVLTGYARNARVQALWLNDGSGRFADATAGRLPPPSNSGTLVHPADLDRDGDIDLLIGGTVWINTGGASFRDETAARMPANVWGSAHAIADFDNDGDLDIIFQAVGQFTQLQLFLDDGTGVWRDATPGRLPLGLGTAAVGDFDGDGDLDLFANGQRLLRNDGRAVFFEAQSPAVPTRPGAWGAVPFDAEGDGDLDLAVVSVYVGGGLLLNDGRGEFRDAAQAWCPMPCDGYPRGLALLDIDGDGDRDVLALADDPCLYRNDGDGLLVAEPWRVPRLGWLQTSVIATGDVDGDGHADAVIAGDANNPQFFLLLNDGAGRLLDASAGRLAYGSRRAVAAVLADLDGDRDLDLLVAEQGAPAALLHNDGQGRFTDVSATHLPRFIGDVAGVAIAPLIGDPLPDIALVVRGGTPRLWRNSPTGFVDVTAAAMPPTPSAAHQLAAGDVDGDGDHDLLLIGYQERSRLYRNDGAGRFVIAPDTHLPGAAVLIRGALVDVDDDHDLDVLSTAALWRNDGSGTFVDVTSARLQVRTEQVNVEAIGDLDGDGDVDLLAHGPSLPLRLYFNHARQLATPLLARPGRRFDLSVEAEPGFATTPRSAAVLLGSSRPPVPVTVPPWGRLALDPRAPLLHLATVHLPAPAGTGAVSFVLPDHRGLRGLSLHCQALLLQASGVDAWRFSNARTDQIFVR